VNGGWTGESRGAGTTSFERIMGWLARGALLVLGVTVAGAFALFPVPDLLAAYLPSVSVGAALTALLASIVARARTEHRTDPAGERSLRFWRGPLGRAVFRIAKSRPPAMAVAPVSILDRLETPA
jgi:hypothetical protein